MNFEELGVDFLLRLFLVNQNIHGGIKLAKAHVKFGLLKSSQGGSDLINSTSLLISTVTHVSPQFQGKPQAFFRHLRGLYSYFSNQETIWRSHSRLEIKELLYVSYITVSFGNSQLQQLV